VGPRMGVVEATHGGQRSLEGTRHGATVPTELVPPERHHRARASPAPFAGLWPGATAGYAVVVPRELTASARRVPTLDSRDAGARDLGGWERRVVSDVGAKREAAWGMLRWGMLEG
jgi:hypothetical protein